MDCTVIIIVIIINNPENGAALSYVGIHAAYLQMDVLLNSSPWFCNWEKHVHMQLCKDIKPNGWMEQL